MAIATKSSFIVRHGELVIQAQTLRRQMQEHGSKSQMVGPTLLRKSPQLVIAELTVLIRGSIFAVLEPYHDLAIN